MTNAAQAEDDQGSPLSRRSLIGRVGVGAGIAWVAPVVLSSPAFAQGTCVVDSVNWLNHESSLNDLATNSFQVGVGSLSTMTVTLDTSNIGSGTGSTTYASTVPLGGESASFAELSIDASAAGEYIELIFTFDNPVDALAFTLLDIDRSLGDWADRVSLFADLAGSAVQLTGADFTITNGVNVNHTALAVDPLATYGAGNRFDGVVDPPDSQPGVDNNTTGGNVAVVYPASIDRFVLRYEPGSNTDLETQQIGLASFSLCVFE